jgi:hypothetical protein
MKFPASIRVLALSIVICSLAAAVAGCSTDHPAPPGQKGFFNGLFAPLSFVPVVISGLVGAEGADNFNQHMGSTWGQGSTSYRIGFVCGVLLLILLVGGIGGGVSDAASKKDSP